MIDVNRFHGRLIDLDSHVQPSPQTYEVAAGEVGKYFTNMLYQMMETMPEAEAKKIKALTAGESSVFNDETVWNMKGSIAPGAFSPDGRLKAMDQMGIDRALIFADPGIMAATYANNELGIRTMHHWNDFVLGFSKQDPNRLRAVALLNTNDIDVATDEAERILKAGGRAFAMASAVAPGDLSPAHQKMDKLWGMLEEATAPVILHAGGEQGFLRSESWGKGVDHLNFQPMDISSESEQINTYMFSSFHYSPQNFLSTIVLGGVFERFPKLRFGVLELGAGWLAPMAERLDQTAIIYDQRLSEVLSMKPSEYVRRNVRVSPYRLEPIADYIDRYGLAECYCFSSDFPHPEGGTSPLQEYAGHIDRLGQGYAEQFFVANGEWLLPPLN
jgi:predicted TIM-barrel fold metal-dependent hydrolase